MSFDKPYKNVPYFGVWAEEDSPYRGTKDAIAVLKEAVDRCYDEDARTEDVFKALAYLEKMGITLGYLKRFKAGLEITDPRERYMAVSKSYQNICKHFI